LRRGNAWKGGQEYRNHYSARITHHTNLLSSQHAKS
jgi:hypothetical protein